MYKVITVQFASTMAREVKFDEIESPKLSGYLEQGWTIKEVHQASTNVNVGFVYITFILYKNKGTV